MDESDRSVLDGLYRAVAFQLDEVFQTLDAVEQSQYIMDASGPSLDRIGEYFEVYRQTGEPDPDYRLRIITRFAESQSSGTLPELSENFARLLDADESDIELNEPDDEPLLVQFVIQSFLLDDLAVSETKLFNTVESFTAAGVSLEGTIRGTFEFATGTSIVSDTETGFSQLDTSGEIDQSVGGRWSYLRR